MKSEAIDSFSDISSGSAKDAPKRPASVTRVMRAGSEDIVVGENSSLEGSFETQGSMFVDGSLTRADLKTSLLSIGTAGSVEGSAIVGRAEIAGTFDGRLEVSGEVILRSTSHVVGEILCGKLISHRGATVKAHVTVADDETDASESGDDVRFPKQPRWQRKLNTGMTRRAATFGYGVFFTLGTIGLVSLLAH